MNAKHFLRSGISLILSAALTSAPTLGNGLLNYVTAADTTTEIYVSPDGNDDASGTFASPLRTLSAARDAVRELNKNMSGDITVYLRGGGERPEAQPVDAHAQLFRQGVAGHEARVVARARIFRAGIAEENNEPGHRAGRFEKHHSNRLEMDTSS